MRGSFHVRSTTAIKTAATESCDAFCRAAGSGASDSAQHDPFGAAATLAVPSSTFIWSHCDCVRGVAHSVIFEEKMAHADRGAGSSPARLSANAKISPRRTTTKFSKKMLPNTPCKVSAFSPYCAVRLVTSNCDYVTQRVATQGGAFVLRPFAFDLAFWYCTSPGRSFVHRIGEQMPVLLGGQV